MSSAAKWLLGVGGLFFVLILIDDLGAGELADALAVTAALSATYVYLQADVTKLGLNGKS